MKSGSVSESVQKTLWTSSRRVLLPGVLAAGLMVQPAWAQETVEEIEEILVVGDPVGLAEQEPTESVFGISKSLLEIPRSVTVLSDITIERYQLDSIKDLVTVSPNTATGSRFGVTGQLTVRGTDAENFFRGFKRVENVNSYLTPVGGARRLEIIRGPQPPVYGAGKVGGMLNFIPRTARIRGEQLITEAEGHLDFTYGSWDRKKVTGSFSAPFNLGGSPAGFSVYAEHDRDGDFFIGRDPDRTLVQASFDMNLAGDVEISAGFQYFRTDGWSQTVGWNRLTQELIDSGIYITGFDTDVSDLNGDGVLTKDEIDSVIGNQFGIFSNIEQFIDLRSLTGQTPEDYIADLLAGMNPPAFIGGPVPLTVADAFTLDTGVGTTILPLNRIYWSSRDFNDSTTYTAYFDIAKEISRGANFDSRAQLRFFYDKLDNKQYTAYGFSTDYQPTVFEVKGDYSWENAVSDNLQFNGVIGVNYRRYYTIRREELGGTYVAPDRCDITLTCDAGNALFDSPFNTPPPGVTNLFDKDIDSDWRTTGGFFLADLTFFDWVNIIGAVRYDDYDVESIDFGEAAFGGGVLVSGDDSDVSWHISGSLLTPWNVVPYITYAEANALEIDNAGDIEPDLVATLTFLQESELLEIGINFSLFDETLFGKIAYYDQERTVLDAITSNISGITNEGVELEARWLATDNFSFTAGYTYQDARFLDPGECPFFGTGEFITIPPSRLGVAPVDGFGGFFAAIGVSCMPELQDGYKERDVPKHTATAFGTYTSEEYSFGTFGVTAGGTYVSDTGGNLLGAVVLPDYWLFRMSAFYQTGRWRIIASVTNLADERAFLPNKSASQEVSAEPVPGRGYQITFQAGF